MGRGRRKSRLKPSGKLSMPLPSKKKKRKQKTRQNKALEGKSKHIAGSAERISRRLMVEMLPETTRGSDGRLQFLKTRYDMKRFVLSSLKESGKPRDPSSVAKLMPIYSDRTRQGYQKVWKSFFTYIREEYGVNANTKVKRWHVEEYMKDIIDRGVSLRTYKTYSAAMSKLEVALNKTRAYSVDFDSTLKQLSKEAKGELKWNDPRRAYVDPDASIATIENDTYRLAAYMQVQGGARISEISELTAERNLRGLRNGIGHIRLTNTKGGRIRIMKVSGKVYRDVRDIIKAEGKFQFTRVNYSRSTARAFKRRGEKWNGTHGLRWNFAQRRFYELQSEEGKSFQEALQIVSFELGHSRPSITLHYLR